MNDKENSSTEHTQENPSDNWIKAIASQSYEPELLISGAGIYLSYNIPFLIEWAFDYYSLNLVSDSDTIGRVLPLLIYGFLKSNAYILVFTFLFHFVMRAFWVGVVGLYSVFPEGIQYDKLGKQYNEHLKAKTKEKLGSTENFILKLDQNCSIIFSSAFMLVFVFIGICYVYLLIMGIMGLCQVLMGDALYGASEGYIYFGILSLALIPSLLVGIFSLERFKQKESIAKLHASIMWKFSTWMYPFVGLALMRLTLIFRSNIPSKQKQVLYSTLASLAVLSLFIFIVLNKLRPEIFEARSFYGDRAERAMVYAQRYDNLRKANDPIPEAALQSDIIKEDYLKLFINYPKRLDKNLKKLCTTPKVDISLNKQEKREFLSQHYLDCMEHFFKIYLNDSLVSNVEYMFYTHPETAQKGVQTVLSTENCQKGKNILTLEYIDSKFSEPDTIKYSIPFWYFKSNEQ